MTAATGPGVRLWAGVVRLLEVLVVLLFVALTLDVLWGVISRYALRAQAPWSEEVATYLLVWVSLLGSALAYRERGHLGVDYFVLKLHPDAQRLAAVTVDIAVLLFAAFALIYGGGLLVGNTLAVNTITPALQWKIGYIYSVVPLSGVCFAAFAVEHLLRGAAVPNAGTKDLT